MTVDEIIGNVIRREGGYVDNPDDKGGPTNMGITAATLGAWNGNEGAASAEQVRTMTRGTARAIYLRRYVELPGFDSLPDPLKEQMVDFGANSGPSRAVRWLQRVIEVPATGKLDDRTRQAVNRLPVRLVNDALVAARLYMVDRWTDADASQKQFEEGVESRALEFFQSRP